MAGTSTQTFKFTCKPLMATTSCWWHCTTLVVPQIPITLIRPISSMRSLLIGSLFRDPFLRRGTAFRTLKSLAYYPIHDPQQPPISGYFGTHSRLRTRAFTLLVISPSSSELAVSFISMVFPSTSPAFQRERSVYKRSRPPLAQSRVIWRSQWISAPSESGRIRWRLDWSILWNKHQDPSTFIVASNSFIPMRFLASMQCKCKQFPILILPTNSLTRLLEETGWSQSIEEKWQRSLSSSTKIVQNTSMSTASHLLLWPRIMIRRIGWSMVPMTTSSTVI